MWQCTHYDSKGVRCSRKAERRIFFSDDPFHFEDLCIDHFLVKKWFYYWEKIPERFGEYGCVRSENSDKADEK